MDTLFSTMASMFEAVFSSLGAFLNLIVANPYLLIGVSLMLIGAGVSFLKRLIRV